MVNSFLATIGKAIRSVNPEEVRGMAAKPINIGLMATTESTLNEMWFWLAPMEISDTKRQKLAGMVHPMGPQLPDMPPPPEKLDIEIWEAGIRNRPDHAFVYYRNNPAQTVADILEKHEDLGIALSRNFLPFRNAVSEKIISAVCNENVLFAVTTSLPNLVPSILTLPFAVGEFASDTAFLTMNQLRMAFLLAGAHDHPIGYRQQKTQVASVIAGAFGWRAIARELVSKIPFGGGVIGKAGISYAGTWVVGRSLERLYRAGGMLSNGEQKNTYAEGLQRGKKIAERMLTAFRAARVKK
ncbi:MAG TPA: hypothetical protein VFQ91_03475 [Bryobacteraceae bacterium]|nr:hypothetical protein [Bryobacteraceae bacterium]